MTIRENKLALVERLADDLAHEIKNPLHSMVINLEVLRRRLVRMGTGPSEDALRYTEILGSELERVNRRVDLLLRLVRPHREGEEAVSIPVIFEELRELVELECARHEVRLEMEAPAELLRTRLPRLATFQAVLSLALETLDALSPGATLVIRPYYAEEGVRIEFTGRGGGGAARRKAERAETGGYLDAANALAAELQGRITTQPPMPDAEAAPHFTLILPAT